MTPAGPTLRIGTRRSRLALAQAEEVRSALVAAGFAAELVPMSTAGDRPDGGSGPRGASPFGVKGLFVDEIVRALREGEIDLAVHSAKDLPAEDPAGVVVAAVPGRADPRDVLVSRGPALPERAVVGTSSPRRAAQLLRARPGASVRTLRGNVETRLARLDAGEVDAVLLAAAGLGRLGLAPEHATVLPVEEMVPAPGQGALAVQARAGDAALDAVGSLDHAPSRRAFEAERSLVARLGGGCFLPLGALAEDLGGGRLRMRAVVVEPDGGDAVEFAAEGSVGPIELAERVVGGLLGAGAAGILARAAGGLGRAE